MAANMGMAGNSHLLMQQQQNNNSNQRQLQHIVYTRLVQNTPAIQPGGWQAGVQINDRLGKTVNLYVPCHFIVRSNVSRFSHASQYLQYHARHTSDRIRQSC
jgi:hypothetical protein